MAGSALSFGLLLACSTVAAFATITPADKVPYNPTTKALLDDIIVGPGRSLTISGGTFAGGGGSWGSITGTFAAQSDLNTALAGKQALDSDLTAIAALSTTSFGRAFLTIADAAALRTYAALGTGATLDVPASGDATSGQIVKGNDTRLTDARTPTSHSQAASTISDSTAAGRALLTAADVAAQRTALALGTAATSATTDFIAASASPASYDIAAIAWTAAFEANRLTPVSDGTALSTWTDFSANARNATASGGARPAYKIAANGINSQPVVRFSSGTYMQTASGAAALTGDWYMAAVIKLSSLTGVSTFLAFGDEATGKRRELVKSSPADTINGANMVSVNGYSADLYGKTVLTTGTPHFVEAIRSGTTVTIYLDGTIERYGTVSYNAYSSALLTLGGNNAGGENFLGDLALGVFLNSAPNGITLTAIRSYVSRVYGITIAGAAATNALVSFPISGTGLTGAAITDDGTTVTLANRRARFSSNGYNQEHIFVADQPLGAPNGAGLNVMRLQQKNPAGYSVTYGVGYDVPEGSEGYGFAQGWGNVNAIAPYGTSAFFESYNSATTTFYPLRFIQTNSAGAYRRQVFDDSTSDILFYGRSAVYPSEGLIATIGTAGFSTAGNLTTTVVGKTLAVKSGTNAKSGAFTLVSGSATVTNTSITVNSVIHVRLQPSGVSGTRAGDPDIVPTIGIGFTATGAGTDNSTYNWWIEENLP